MENALIAFVSIMVLGGVIFYSLWWEGGNVGFTFAKWFFGIFFVAAMVVGGYTYFMS
ncbi:hypothetical protein [Paenibacillus tyrfis]|uniref:hypothetical protein n=1 Tax=Paenibacillus tyrfis TaxID=1501230 RepID=UPI002492B70F|nr:hypothetical protein [Paenibacillus tyrfis]